MPPRKANPVRLNANELEAVPIIAWPTVLLAVSAVSLWVASFYWLHRDRLSEPVCVLLSSCAAFGCFTSAHDASHWAIGKKTPVARFLNESTGRICAIPLLSPFVAFRHVHLLHHKHTNNAQLDPDHYTQGGFWCWLSAEFYYYVYFVRNRQNVPKKVFYETMGNFVLLLVGLTALVGIVGARAVMLGALLPQRLAVLWLACSFDYVPHKGAMERSIDPYKATKRIVRLFRGGSTTRYRASFSTILLRIVTAEQDAHVVHHLYPTFPFYMYHAVWDCHDEEFYKAGVENTSLF